MSLFDTRDFGEIEHPDYPGERLICPYNPFLAAERARKREALLAATEKELAKIGASASAGRLRDAGKIGERIGKVIGKHKVARRFITEITGASFTYRRDQEKITAEAVLDGIYVIRASVKECTLDPAAVITACKNLKYVERDFRVIKADDLDLRPIYHYLDKRVRGHVLIAMLAAYLTWHLRAALAELTFTDQHIPVPASPSPPRAAHPRQKPKTPPSSPSANTATCSATCSPSTGRPSPSAASRSASSPSPTPSSAAASNYLALTFTPCPVFPWPATPGRNGNPWAFP
jgi:hypothetical protein